MKNWFVTVADDGEDEMIYGSYTTRDEAEQDRASLEGYDHSWVVDADYVVAHGLMTEADLVVDQALDICWTL